jgi:cytosine/uracil/thiamine/allantoin permease
MTRVATLRWRKELITSVLINHVSPSLTIYVLSDSSFTMALKHRLRKIDQKVRLRGDDEKHEQTDAWSNRDLIPLPPERRTWGWFNFFGFWAISSLNLANWQTPSTFLSKSSRMTLIAISR